MTSEPLPLDELLAHLSARGAVGLENVAVVDHGPPRGRGLHAVSAIQGGSRILAIPLELCVTVGLAEKALGSKFIAEFDAMRDVESGLVAFAGLGRVDDVALLALFLLRAKAELALNGTFDRENGFLDERTQRLLELYMPSLPNAMQGGFENDEAASAQVSDLFDRLRPLIAENSDVFRHYSWENVELFSPRSFLWAYSCVLSRSMTFALPSGRQLIAMVPIADMINHRSSPQNLQYQIFATEEQTINIYARWDYEPGEEILINYGKGVGQGTLHYGFLVT